ncbi:hypothetical protein MKY37_02205 [Psychrobacillus sp. FSL K6-2836]|uniref:hypothetical protein n=1 Tax=Psychrobacillus sp. FSL K6-2836 TaxID=2921548 RepID=UPI0030F4F412
MKEKKLKRAVIREELIAVTKNLFGAVILNQLLYWTKRVKDYEQFATEEINRIQNPDENMNQNLLYGWIYKKADELREETMLCCNENTIRNHLKMLVTKGYLDQRNNSKHKWDRTYQYRVNLKKLMEDLNTLQFHLEGFETFYRNSNFEVRSIEDFGTIPEITSETTPKNTTNLIKRTKNDIDNEKVAQLFLKLSKRNELTNNDLKAIKRILKMGYGVEKILIWTKECFENYQPVKGIEGIWAFNYIAKFIEQQGEDTNENNGRNITRSTTETHFEQSQQESNDNGRWLGDTECDF